MAIDPKIGSSLLTPDDVPSGTMELELPVDLPESLADDPPGPQTIPASVPLPPPILAVWRSFVRDQAGRGKRQISRMVPVLLDLLVERGVQDIKPDIAKKKHLERLRDALAQEHERLGEAIAGLKGDRISGGYAALDLTALSNIEADPSFAPQPLHTREALLRYHKDLEAHQEGLRQSLAHIGAQEQTMARQRLTLAQRLAAHSDQLLSEGASVLAAFDEEQRVLQQKRSEAQAQADATLSDTPAASGDTAPLPTTVGPGPNMTVTYKALFQTLGRVVAGWVEPILALEPEPLARLRRKGWQALLDLMRPR